MAIKPLINENELLAKIATGDQRAFNELFEAYYNILGEYVLKITKSLPASEEIVQDTFIKIWLKRSGLPDIKNFTYYLFILCRNGTLDHLRKEAKQRQLHTELENHLLEESQHEDQDAPTEVYRSLIDQAVNKLPAQAQKVYIMSRHQRLKHEEIASQLNISPETVKKHIQYAIAFIKTDVSVNMDLGILAILLSPLLFK